MRPRIVYQDDAVIVAYKPAGLATQTARVGQADMVSELKKELAACERAQGTAGNSAGKDGGKSGVQNRKTQPAYLGVVHRLDQPVEGLLVFAKNSKAAAELSKQLTEGSLNKQYFAVVCGKPAAKAGELVDYMIKSKDNVAQIVERSENHTINTEKEACKPDCTKQTATKGDVQGKDIKKAVLKYKILEDVSTPATLALADIHIETGRFHQIRCQMAHAGMPLLGDLKYGNDVSVELGRKLGIRNVALCAHKLVFRHPVTQRKMSFEIKPENKAFDYFLENNFGCDCLY